MTTTPKLSPRMQAVVEALPLRPDSRVLEIGCGPGAAARAIAARLTTGHILAIDRSTAAIAQAKAAAHDEIALGHMEVRHIAAENFVLQPGEAPYDLVFAVRVRRARRSSPGSRRAGAAADRARDDRPRSALHRRRQPAARAAHPEVVGVRSGVPASRTSTRMAAPNSLPMQAASTPVP